MAVCIHIVVPIPLLYNQFFRISRVRFFVWSKAWLLLAQLHLRWLDSTRRNWTLFFWLREMSHNIFCTTGYSIFKRSISSTFWWILPEFAESAGKVDFKRARSCDEGFDRNVPVSQRAEHTLSGHKGPVLCFSMYGDKQLFSGSADCTIKVFVYPHLIFP